MKIREVLARLQARYPQRDADGMLYSGARGAARLRYRKIRLYSLLISNENTHQVHECLIEKKRKPKTRRAWALWIAKNADDVYRKGVLPGIGLRTAPKQWALKKLIGWVPSAALAIPKKRARKPARKK